MHYATKMKKLMMVIVLGLSIGCAGTSNLVPSKIGVTRDSFMERAQEFDQKWAGQVETEKYQYCYNELLRFLFTKCRLLSERDMMDEYWGCADIALDEMEDCLE